jgi:uncharacterized protein YcgI (DUF1989 family)
MFMRSTEYPFDDAFYEGLIAEHDSFELIEERLVQPETGFGFRVNPGQVFRFTQVDGVQCIDVCMMNSENPTERFASGAQTWIEGAHITRFTRIWGSPPASRPLATCVWDTVRPRDSPEHLRDHTSYGAHCNPHEWVLYTEVPHASCYDNLRMGMEMLGLSPRLIHDNMNLFSKGGFDPWTGGARFLPSDAEPGDHIEFYAELPLTVVFSICPWGDVGAGLTHADGASLHSADEIRLYPIGLAIYDTSVKPLGWLS